MAERLALLTRPLEESRQIAERLAEEGLNSLLWPLTRIVATGDGIALPPGVDALIVTSAHGIRAFASLNPRRDLPVLAVGGRTAQTARGLGFPGVVTAEGDAEALIALVRATGFRRLFYPRGRDVSVDLVAALSGPARAVTEAVVYAAEETGPPPRPALHAMATGRVGIATVWSRRHGAILAKHLDQGLSFRRDRTALVAISDSAAAPLAAAGFAETRIAVQPDAQAMVAAILAAVPGSDVGGRPGEP